MYKKTFYLFLLLLLMSCSGDDIETKRNCDYVENIPLKFQGHIVDYDSKSNITTRSESNEQWPDGACIYIRIYNNFGGENYGKATYYSSKGWIYSGALIKGKEFKCDTYYFENPTSVDGTNIELNTATKIYEDVNGSYSYNNEEICVNTRLTPKTGRIRFKGVPGERLYISGIETYTRMVDIGYFYHLCKTITINVNEDGFTPYIYGELYDSERKISVGGQSFACYKTCSNNVLLRGSSGYMDSPSINRNKWNDGFYVAIKKYTNGSRCVFKMIPVEKHSSGFYLIGETEVTEAQYSAVFGNGSESTSLMPKTNKSFSSAGIKDFINNLNTYTNLFFSLPTIEQWTYAAKGGNKSKGYIYAGSNNISDVAWYSNNSTSVHTVKSKTPNELGIYDMSGNVAEAIKDKYYPYGGGYACGGSYSEDASSCEINSKKAINTILDDRTIGFRLILTFD